MASRFFLRYSLLLMTPTSVLCIDDYRFRRAWLRCGNARFPSRGTITAVQNSANLSWCIAWLLNLPSF